MPEAQLHTAADLAYAAGIIDGEGSIQIIKIRPNGTTSKSTYIRTYMSVCMTDRGIPQWFADTFGGTARTTHSAYFRKNGYKPITTWRLHGRSAAELCKLLIPYLRLKRPQAEVLCEYCADPLIAFKRGSGHGVRLTDAEVSLRLEYWQRMHELNKRRSAELGVAV